MYKKKIFFNVFIYIICIFLSYNLFLISSSELSWRNFWEPAFIPTMWPPFADMNHFYGSILSHKAGYDINVNNPFEFSGTTFQAPIIWLYIFDIFKLYKKNYYDVFLIITISIYLFTYFKFFLISKKYLSKLAIFILFFSTSNLLLIERGNVDHILFFLIFFVATIRSYYISIALCFFSSIAKVYPVFSFMLFLKDKPKILITYFLIFLVIAITYWDMTLHLKGDMHIWVAIIPSYGSGSVAEAAYHLLKDYNIVELNNHGKSILRIIFLSFFMILSLIAFILGQKKTYNDFKENIVNKLFIVGASIYLGSYIFLSNIDYRLPFLFLTIPYLIENKSKINITLSIFILICAYSFRFSIGGPHSLIFTLNALFIWGIKFIVFMFLSYEMGRLYKNFFKKIFFLR